MGIYARHNGEWYNVYEGGKLGGSFSPAQIVTPPQGTSGLDVQTFSVKDKQGNNKTIYLLPGDTGMARSLAFTEEAQESVDEALRQAVLTTEVPDDFDGDPITLLPKNMQSSLRNSVETVSVPKLSATYTVELTGGVLPGVMVGAGGAGGSSGATYYGGGGGSGAVIGHGAHVPVILPVQGEATYIITVAPTSPGGTPTGTSVLNMGLPTTIAVEGQEPFQVAIGGGRGWGNYTGSASQPAVSGASGGGGHGASPYGFNNYGLGTPGLGNDGASGPIAGNYSGGGGGYSSPGNARDGGNGFDLATALNLSTTDPDTLALLGLVTQDGFIAGGGTGVNGGTATGGGGQYTGGISRDGKDFTGGGGSGHGAAISGSGGAGMALLITETP